jgi:enoyl-CoA hydratase
VDDIIFSIDGVTGRVTLNRPQALNALTLVMARRLDAQLQAWADDDRVQRVVVEGAGVRAFCAGGDVRDLYEAMARPGDPLIAAFYRDEYILNHRIKTYGKPYVALIDGVVMGGGVGVSIHGSQRVVTENALFAMPETGIGLFPDVGGTWFLPRMPGETGLYLGLTGARLRAADALYCGVATHYIPRAGLAGMTASADDLDRLAEDPGEPPLATQRESIDRCFAGDSVDAIIAALGNEGGEWSDKTLAVLATKSPTSLKVAFRQIRAGASLDFAAAMALEYRLSQRFCAAHDFREGVRAVIIEKDQKPQWQPPDLEAVSAADVDAYFAPLEGGDLLL